MSDKAGSDLDVFDGLAAKKSRPGNEPAPVAARVPAAPRSSATRQKTLLGLAAPLAPGAARSAPPPPPLASRPGPPSPRGSLPPPPTAKFATGGFPVPPPPPNTSAFSAPPPPPAPLAGLAATVTPPPQPSSAESPSASVSWPPTPVPHPAIKGSKPFGADDEKTPVPAVKGEGKPGVDIDWDDEDEATMVFDKSIEDTARSLLHSAPPPPPPPPPAAGAPPPAAGAPPAARAAALLNRPVSSVPPPSLPRAPLPPPPRTTPAAYTPPIPPQHAVFEAPPMAQPMSSGRYMMIGLVVLLLAGAGAGVMFLMPKKGSMVLTVAGPGNKPVDTVEVYVDGLKKCEASPCRVVDLAAGTHLVKVTAAGYQPTADQAVKITSGDEAVQNIALTRASDGTGIRVSAEGRGIKLSVDGKEVGPLPQELKDLSPGDHLVHLDGGDRYDSFEKHVTVDADQMQTIEPKLRVKKGLATIKLGDNADGAKVLLVSGSERRPLPTLPITVDISVDKPYSVVATKKGFGDFEERVAFEDGQAERTFVVNLAASASSNSASDSTPGPAPVFTPRATSTPVSTSAAAAHAASTSAAATGNGILNMNAIPASNVLLDGRPMGQTPKLGVSVLPGLHTIVFVNADKGRKSQSITVVAGKTSTVVVRF